MYRILLALICTAMASVVAVPAKAQLKSVHVKAIVTEVKVGQTTMVPHYYGDRDVVMPVYEYIWVDTLTARYAWEDERTGRPSKVGRGTFRTTSAYPTESRPAVGDTVSCDVTYSRGQLVSISNYTFWPARRSK